MSIFSDLREIIYEHGGYIPNFIQGFSSEPHYQKILYADAGRDFRGGRFKFLLTSGSHAQSIKIRLNLVEKIEAQSDKDLETYRGGSYIEELLVDSFSENKPEIENQVLLKKLESFIKDFKKSKFRNNSIMNNK